MIHEEEKNIDRGTKTIGSLLSSIVGTPTKGQPTHEIAATVDEITKVIPLTKRYGFGFWLKLVKQSGVSYTEMFALLKEVKNMGNDKTGKPYNKAGTLVNKLKKLCLSKQSTKSFTQN